MSYSLFQQVTFQGRDVDESRYMYDQLAVLAPIMLAMTAATPIFKGAKYSHLTVVSFDIYEHWSILTIFTTCLGSS